MKKYLFIIVFIIILFATQAHATDEFGFNFGLWLESSVFISQDDSFFTENIKAYCDFLFTKNMHLYVRLKDYITVKFGVLESGENRAVNVFDLDVGFFALETGVFKMEIGRTRFSLGNGVIFNNYADGLNLEFKLSFMNIEIFGNYTGFLAKDFNPLKFADPEYRVGDKRIFAGGAFEFENIFNLRQNITIIGLGQFDFTKPKDTNEDIMEEKEYSSYYIGLNLTGVIVGNFYYSVEGAYQGGNSHYLDGTGTLVKNTISAFMVNGSLTYNIIKKPVNLSVKLEAAWASGDEDRISDEEPDGNESGLDNMFRAFGSFSTGFSYIPTFSNKVLYRATVTLNPFFFAGICENFILIAQYTYYQRDKANVTSAYLQGYLYLGSAVDFFINWRILSDITIVANFGMFFPGSAFSDKTMDYLGQFGLNLYF